MRYAYSGVSLTCHRRLALFCCGRCKPAIITANLNQGNVTVPIESVEQSVIRLPCPIVLKVGLARTAFSLRVSCKQVSLLTTFV